MKRAVNKVLQNLIGLDFEKKAFDLCNELIKE